jgi:hypothetical protein
LAVAIENLKNYMQMRNKTDRHMSNYWLLFYFSPVIISLAIVGYFLFSFFAQFSSVDSFLASDFTYAELQQLLEMPWFTVGLTNLITYSVSLVFTYFLVNRRTTHFKRQNWLFTEIISSIRSVATTKDDVDVTEELMLLEQNVNQANADKTEKNPILWAVLSTFIPFLALYVYYFMMTDFYNHEQFENKFWETTSNTLNKLGINFSVPQRTQPMQNRSFVMYFILAIVTVGIFGVYWLYVLVNDPNTHFKQHVPVETQLLSALESAKTQKSADVTTPEDTE